MSKYLPPEWSVACTCPAVSYSVSWAEESSEQMNASSLSFTFVSRRSLLVSSSLRGAQEKTTTLNQTAPPGGGFNPTP